jgi:hypothetical protein
VTATARKIAVLFYNAVRHGMEYVDPGASVEPHAPGSKILIFPPGSSLPLPTILFQRNGTRLDGLIKDAKDIVDDHLAMSATERRP